MVAFFFALRSLETFSRICSQRLPGSRPVTVKFHSLSLSFPIYEKEEAVKAHSQSPASLLMSSRNSVTMAAFKYCCFLACYKRALRTLAPALFHPPHKARRPLENFHKTPQQAPRNHNNEWIVLVYFRNIYTNLTMSVNMWCPCLLKTHLKSF